MSGKAPVLLMATTLLLGLSACKPKLPQPFQPPQLSPTPTDDTAVGKGLYMAGIEEWMFHFDVRSKPNGDDPSGIMILERTDGIFSAKAEAFCLAVSGSGATMVGDIYQHKNFPGYEELVIKVEERGGTTPDSIVHIVEQAGKGLAECFPETPAWSVTAGNIEVHDAP